jgi:ABC-type bacteriocin/lantibiotic exporter with double-glycine peptidase domain
MKTRRSILIMLLAACVCPGCALFVSVPPLEPLPNTRVVLSGVEYTPQESGTDCGPACLTTVMRYHGSELTLADVTAQLKQIDSGTIVPEMIYGARKNGFRCTLLDGNINDVRRLIHEGKPVVLFLHPMPGFVRVTGLRRGHYIVAVGYDDAQRLAIIHTGGDAFDTMSYRQLQLQWGRASFIALLIESPPR